MVNKSRAAWLHFILLNTSGLWLDWMTDWSHVALSTASKINSTFQLFCSAFLLFCCCCCCCCFSCQLVESLLISLLRRHSGLASWCVNEEVYATKTGHETQCICIRKRQVLCWRSMPGRSADASIFNKFETKTMTTTRTTHTNTRDERTEWSHLSILISFLFSGMKKQSTVV